MNRKQMRVARNKTFVAKFKIDNPCSWCGFSIDTTQPDWWKSLRVLELHHKDDNKYRTATGKLVHPSDLVKSGASLDVLKAELDKCEVLCSNCHAKETSENLGKPAWIDLMDLFD